MHLITALTAGVNGAASGTATLAKRGTSTPATWYSSFEGDGTSTATVTLDSNGGAVVFVNELVTVTVKDSSGATVRTFTDGVAAPAVEVQSASFTGTNYEDASSAAGEPATLQAVLDAWKTSAGTTDWNVLINGTAATLQDFAGFAAGLVYNVKSPEYGATGDGTTDDSAAIQAAVDAAETASGGIVYFPPGTYYIDADIDIADDVVALGAGRDLSTLEFNAYDFSVAGAAGKVFELRNLALHATTHGDAQTITVTGSQEVKAYNCRFGGSASANAVTVAARLDDGDATFSDCEFYIFEHAIDARTGAAGGTYRVSDCEFYLCDATYGAEEHAIGLTGSVSLVIRNTLSDVTNATYPAIAFGILSVVLTEAAFTGNIYATDNQLVGLPTGTTPNHSFLQSNATAPGDIQIDGLNHRGIQAGDGNYGVVDIYNAPTSCSVKGLPTNALSSNAATYVFCMLHESEVITRTDSTALVIDLWEAGSGPGDIRRVAVKNTSGSTSVTFATTIQERATPITVSSGETYVFQFMRIVEDSSVFWVEIGTAAAAT